MSNFDARIPVHTIIAGKFRRYHHLSVIRQLFWPSVVILNIRDFFLAIAGFFQSIFKMIIWRPDIVFTKGGYVCLPVGIAARLLGIPLVIHDSDAHPGLTNLILSKWATAITTGAPLKYYPYSAKKSHYVGIPVAADFHKFSDEERRDAKLSWGVKPDRPLMVVTGGGLGASRINDAIVETLKDYLELGSLILISGVGQYDELRSITPPNDDNFQLHSFISKDMTKLLGAADIVIARAGATTIIELAALAKPTILIPNAKLSGGHQLKNAAVYLKDGAVVVVDEDEMVNDKQVLVTAVRDLLANPLKMQQMSKAFEPFARPNAAIDVANIILANIK